MLRSRGTVADPGMGAGMFFAFWPCACCFRQPRPLRSRTPARSRSPSCRSRPPTRRSRTSPADGSMASSRLSITARRAIAAGRSGCASCRKPASTTRSDAALAVRKGRQLDLRAYDSGARAGQLLSAAAVLPEYRGEETALYALPAGRMPGNPIYVRVDASGIGAERLDLLPAVAGGRTRARPCADAHGCGRVRRAARHVR